MKYIKASILTILLFQSILVAAQNYEGVDYPMSVYGSDLDYGFLGGLTNPQFSNVDFNQDGALDLFVFDRNGNRIYTFLHTGEVGEESFVYSPQYEASFPALHDWALMIDYDGDGIEDIFGSPPEPGVAGIGVFKGRIDNGIWSFDRVTFDDDPLDIIYYDFTSVNTGNISRSDLYVAFNTDVPAIVDVDGDGDVDILSFDSGGTQLGYYRNLAVENDLGLETLYFEEGDPCWGKFKEGGQDATVTLSENPDLCASIFFAHEDPIANLRHSGSTVCAFDGDGDGDMDVMLGDIGSSTIVYLENGGTSDLAFVDKQVPHFPESEGGVDLYIFPSIFYVDVNNDGKRDLIASSNHKESGINKNHIWYYENTNTDDSPVFALNRKDFLMNATINIGRYTAPAFIDYNADGLTDILVGSSGLRTDSDSRELGLYLFENVGSLTAPAFDLVDDDYLGFSQLVNFSNRLTPTFGDLDGDGDLDLLIGDNNGKLYHFENKAGINQPVVFNTYTYEYMDIDVGNNATPQIIDLNQDGLMDLMIGENKNNQVGGEGTPFGSHNYFQNIGTSTEPKFGEDATIAPNSTTMGLVYSEGDKAFAPYFYKDGEEVLLFCGSSSGTIRVYDDIRYTDEAFNLKDSGLGNINIGRFVMPALNDIDGDGFLELLLGNARGGLDFYNTTYSVQGIDTGIEESKPLVAKIFPNPTKGIFHIESEEEFSSVKIYDIAGKPIKIWIGNNNQYSIEDVLPGVYIVRVNTMEGQMANFKLIVNNY